MDRTAPGIKGFAFYDILFKISNASVTNDKLPPGGAYFSKKNCNIGRCQSGHRDNRTAAASVVF
jgi:hypothetical protein